MQTRRSFIGTIALAGGTLLHSELLFCNFPAMNAKKVQGISLLDLISNDLDALEKFYAKILDLRVTRVNPRKIKVDAGSTELFFSEDNNYKDPIYHFAFNIPENKLDEAMFWLKKKNVVLSKRNDGSEKFHFPNWNADSVYWQDPAGNVLEFIARHNLPNKSTNEFSGADVLYASEIGLVVDNVQEEIPNINTQLGLEPFKGYANNFAAIGNEHNLLILVEKSRPWLGGSANIPALPFPVRTHLKSGNKKGDMQFSKYPFTISSEI
jgi:catechol-2,3-dioxygenase